LIPAADYLRMSYYEKWFAGLVELMIAKGLITRAELESGHISPTTPRASPALRADQVPAMLSRGSPANRDASGTIPVFAIDQAIRTRNINPIGHTRLPRYARAKRGSIARIHGVFVFPDSNALDKGEQPQHLYCVRFTAQELWGASAQSTDVVYLDLWEDYLESA
jgi:nitrile hydratase beta subunit